MKNSIKERHIVFYNGHRLSIEKLIGEHGYGLHPVGKKTIEYISNLSDDEWEKFWDWLDV